MINNDDTLHDALIRKQLNSATIEELRFIAFSQHKVIKGLNWKVDTLLKKIKELYPVLSNVSTLISQF